MAEVQNYRMVDPDWAVAEIERRTGHVFFRRELALMAITHSSGANHRDCSNERLEFLGDAILGFIIAEMLHRRDPRGAEGDKTRIRARLVSTPTLVAIGRSFDLGSLVLMTSGEEKNDGRTQEKVQEDAVEALIAARRHIRRRKLTRFYEARLRKAIAAPTPAGTRSSGISA